MENLPDLSTLSDKELKELIRELVGREQEVSYQRRILHGQIDILRAELVQRLSSKQSSGESLISDDDVSKLSDILARREPLHPKATPERE